MDNEEKRIRNIAISGAISIPVGMIAIAIGLIIVTGDINQAVSLIGMSIICTLGISLLIWIPLCWVVGLVIVGTCLGILKLLNIGMTASFPGLNRPVNEVFQPVLINRTVAQQQSLANYIRKAMNKGFSKSQIHNRLRQEGWSDAEIEQAQDLVDHFN